MDAAWQLAREIRESMKLSQNDPRFLVDSNHHATRLGAEVDGDVGGLGH